MEEIKLYKTTKKGLKIIGLTIPFVVIGIWMITQEPYGTTNYIIGWVCTCFFGLGFPIGLFQTFDKRPQIIINDNSIWDRTTNQDEIKWEQIIEAYPLDINGQKFISLVTNDTFVFKKKPYKWAAKINEYVGAQNLNLSLGQINIDECDLTNFINELCKASTNERKTLIREFQFKVKIDSPSNSQKYFLYASIAIALLLFSVSSDFGFWTAMISMGIAAIVARWTWGTDRNSKLHKYASLMTYFGCLNMVLLFLTMKSFDYTTNKIGLVITNEIDNYKDKHGTYPSNLQDINEKLDFNLIERYLANKIEYKPTENNYKLEIKALWNGQREFNKDSIKWR